MQTSLEGIIFTGVVLILSVIIHEVAHGYAANALGDPTAKLQGRLTLNPVPHIDLVGTIIMPIICALSPGNFMFGWAKPVPYNPYNLRNQRWGEAFVGVAGVATNLLIAIVFALISRFSFAQGDEVFGGLAALVAYINLFLGLFNLIPFPPLDGFTVLRSLLPLKYSLQLRSVEQSLGGFSGLLAFLFIFYFILAKPFHSFVVWVFGFLVG
jgi:Zn-dependent protease